MSMIEPTTTVTQELDGQAMLPYMSPSLVIYRNMLPTYDVSVWPKNEFNFFFFKIPTSSARPRFILLSDNVPDPNDPAKMIHTRQSGSPLYLFNNDNKKDVLLALHFIRAEMHGGGAGSLVVKRLHMPTNMHDEYSEQQWSKSIATLSNRSILYLAVEPKTLYSIWVPPGYYAYEVVLEHVSDYDTHREAVEEIDRRTN